MAFWPYWGKAAQVADEGPDHHLLAYHSLDVAAVGHVLTQRHPRFKATVADLLDMADEAFSAYFLWFLALHDLGKFAGPFQNQRPDLVERLGGEKSSRPYSVRHDSAGWALWQSNIRREAQIRLGLPKESRGWLDVWARCVTGHHGQPPTNQIGAQRIRTHQEFSPVAVTAAGSWVTALSVLLPLPPVIERDWKELRQTAELGSWWIAGAAVLADWLGSNTAWFPYETQRMSLPEYWQRAVAQAERAVEESGILPAPTTGTKSFAGLWPGWSPSPVQALADNINVTEPLCVVIEDVMGAGKTEAALLLAHRLIAAGQADGLFWGLPTMATANALLPRMQSATDKLFERPPSVMLAHSQRKLVEFLGGDNTASDRAHNWLLENNRRALLSQVGVGTIDQALLSALHSRHNTLRLLGLLGKVLVVDEVHACDTYMRQVLCVLLELHARSGGSAILLSATLPRAQRQELADAWRKGRRNAPGVLQSYEYPLVTVVTDENVIERPLTTRPSLKRRVNVELVSSDDAASDRIVAASNAGQCVVWIRNTVGEAIRAFRELQTPLGDRVDLFHARFTLGDRLAIERRVLDRFGKDSTPEDRAGCVLVATQVVEQSIDLDFDFMVTDIAPVELLLQRAGRLHRHDRGNRGHPVLLINGPAPESAADQSWLRASMPGTSFVYEDHGQLWFGLRLLLAQNGFETPAAARTLVEAVYGPGATEQMPPDLQQVTVAADARAKVAGATGRANAINPRGSYEIDGPDWWRDELTPTRLGEPSITLALGVWNGQELEPLHPGPMGWALSSVSVRASSFGLPDNPSGAVTRDATGSIGRWKQPLVLERVDGTLVGRRSRDGKASSEVRYDACSGLVWEPG